MAKREYRLDDLIEIASQLDARVRFELVPRELCEPPLPFDPHALAMALQLATLLYKDWIKYGDVHPGDNFDMAIWLRAEVQKELQAQP